MKKKIIQMVVNDTGQIIVLTDKGKMYCQQHDNNLVNTITGKWFEIEFNSKLILK